MITDDELDRRVAEAFGRPSIPASGSTRATALEAFRDAGFCDTDAERAVTLLESGHYLGFEDVATSMGCFDQSFRGRNPAVTSQRIRETAIKYKSHAALHEPGARMS